MSGRWVCTGSKTHDRFYEEYEGTYTQQSTISPEGEIIEEGEMKTEGFLVRSTSYVTCAICGEAADWVDETTGVEPCPE